MEVLNPLKFLECFSSIMGESQIAWCPFINSMIYLQYTKLCILRGRTRERERDRDFKGIRIIAITQLFPSLKQVISKFYADRFQKHKISRALLSFVT